MTSPTPLRLIVAAFLLLLLPACQKPQLSSQSGRIEDGIYSKYWSGGPSTDAALVDFIIYTDYSPGKKSSTFGSSPAGSGYHDLDGRVTRFQKRGSSLVILGQTFELANGRFFQVNRSTNGSLEVRQAPLTDPIARKIVAIP